MTEEKAKKYVAQCWAISLISLLLIIILLITLAVNIDVFSGVPSNAVKVAAQLMWAGFLVPIVVRVAIKEKLRGSKTESRIKALEDELERLKRAG